VWQLAVPDRAPELIEQVLRQANVNASNEDICAQRFQFADSRPQLFQILMVVHNSA